MNKCLYESIPPIYFRFFFVARLAMLLYGLDSNVTKASVFYYFANCNVQSSYNKIIIIMIIIL